MADDEISRSSGDDFEEFYDENEGIDNEGTLDEEEAIGDEDYDDEIRGLEEDGEMSIEELRRLYGAPAEVVRQSNEEVANQPESSGLQYFIDAEAEETEDEDQDYEDPYKKEIRVDEELYQARLPDWGEESSTHSDSAPLWRPTDKISNDEINQYIQDIFEIRRGIGQVINTRYSETRDDEDSLAALYRSEYDIERAKASFPFPQVNRALRTVRPAALDWDDEEKDTFENAFAKEGKDFYNIKNNSSLHYRNIGELVDYYYKWKKTDRYKEFQRRLEEERRRKEEERYRRFAAALAEEQVPPEAESEQPPELVTEGAQFEVKEEQYHQFVAVVSEEQISPSNEPPVLLTENSTS